MSHTISGTDAYPIPTTTVPDGGDPATATAGPIGIDTPLQAHEDAIATLAGRIGNRTSGNAEWAYPSARGRAVRVPALGGSASPYYVPPGGAATAVTAALWRQFDTIAAGAGPGGRDLVTPTGKVYTSLTFHTYVRQIDRLVMNGGTVVLASVRVTKGTAQAVATDRMSVEFYKTDLLGARTSIASQTANNAAGDETLTMVVTETIDLSSFMYYLAVTSSAGAAPGTDDFMLGGALNWNDPGPRN